MARAAAAVGVRLLSTLCSRRSPQRRCCFFDFPPTAAVHSLTHRAHESRRAVDCQLTSASCAASQTAHRAGWPARRCAARRRCRCLHAHGTPLLRLECARRREPRATQHITTQPSRGWTTRCRSGRTSRSGVITLRPRTRCTLVGRMMAGSTYARVAATTTTRRRCTRLHVACVQRRGGR